MYLIVLKRYYVIQMFSYEDIKNLLHKFGVWLEK